jgi:hypothetical protein
VPPGSHQAVVFIIGHRADKSSTNYYFLAPTYYFSSVVFYITIKHNGRTIRLKVERLEETAVFDKYRVTARNTTFILQSNKPLLRGKGLKYKKIDWKVIEGGISRNYVLEKIIEAIEAKTE